MVKHFAIEHRGVSIDNTQILMNKPEPMNMTVEEEAAAIADPISNVDRKKIREIDEGQQKSKKSIIVTKAKPIPKPPCRALSPPPTTPTRLAMLQETVVKIEVDLNESLNSEEETLIGKG
jgi:hypothetical protein